MEYVTEPLVLYLQWLGKLSFSDTNARPITTDELAYVLLVRLHSPPINDRVENGVRRFDKHMPYFTDHYYTSAMHNYYAN